MAICNPPATRPVTELLEGSKRTPEPFISIPEALSLLPGMTKNHLAQLRFDGKGPKWYNPVGRTIYYKASEVLAWVNGGSSTEAKHNAEAAA